MDLNAYSTPLLFCFIQAWVYAAVLGIRGLREQRLQDVLMALLLVVASLEIIDYLLGFAGIDVLWNELEFFPRDLSLLLGPLVWLYLRAQTDATFRLQWRHLFHAVPAVLQLSYHLVVFAQGRAVVIHWEQTQHFPHIQWVEVALEYLSVVVYLFISLRLVRYHRKRVLLHASDPRAHDLRWFNWLLGATALGVVSSWGIDWADRWLNMPFTQDWWGELYTALIIYALGPVGYAQKSPSWLPEVDPQFGRAHTDSPVYNQVVAFMLAAKPYLNPTLTLASLAQQAELSPQALSQAVNQQGSNLSDFVNRFRVEHFKRLALDETLRHLSLLGLALESGFNSKATFNRAFRKQEGLAPSEWRAKQVLHTERGS